MVLFYKGSFCSFVTAALGMTFILCAADIRTKHYTNILKNILHYSDIFAKKSTKIVLNLILVVVTVITNKISCKKTKRYT